MGFSVVEAVSQCQTYFGRPNKKGTSVDMVRFQKENSVTVEKAAKMSEAELNGKIVTGVFIDKDIPGYVSEYSKISSKF